MEPITTVKEAWDWTGLEPDQSVGDNDFCHLSPGFEFTHPGVIGEAHTQP